MREVQVPSAEWTRHGGIPNAQADRERTQAETWIRRTTVGDRAALCQEGAAAEICRCTVCDLAKMTDVARVRPRGLREDDSL